LKNLIDFAMNVVTTHMGWGSVLKNPDRLPGGGGYLARRAGVQFSKTLIDFGSDMSDQLTGWGSVLKNPDRLQVAQKILFNMVFWAT
ncbi:hypothetical protein ACQXXY_04680, partial [Corynebacterium diphtheriae]